MGLTSYADESQSQVLCLTHPPACQGPIPGDLNHDCYVNFSDFAVIAQYWLLSGNPQDSASGIVAYWSFDEGTGNTVHDYSKNGNNGQLNGGVTSIDGVSGKALDFDGVDGYVNFNNTIGNFGTDDFSVTFWFRTDSNQPETVMVKRVFCGAHSFFEVSMSDGATPTGHMNVEVYETNDNHNSMYSKQRLDDNQWHLIIIMRQGVETCLYIDGSLDNNDSSTQIVNVSNSASFRLCDGPCRSVGNTDFFSGELDEVLIYNRALTATEVQYLYENH